MRNAHILAISEWGCQLDQCQLDILLTTHCLKASCQTTWGAQWRRLASAHALCVWLAFVCEWHTLSLPFVLECLFTAASQSVHEHLSWEVDCARARWWQPQLQAVITILEELEFITFHCDRYVVNHITIGDIGWLFQTLDGFPPSQLFVSYSVHEWLHLQNLSKHISKHLPDIANSSINIRMPGKSWYKTSTRITWGFCLQAQSSGQGFLKESPGYHLRQFLLS